MLSKGHTLIELMIVVAIIGLISVIAYPSYQGYTCDTFVNQAVGDMHVCAHGMERYYSNGFTYAGAVKVPQRRQFVRTYHPLMVRHNT